MVMKKGSEIRRRYFRICLIDGVLFDSRTSSSSTRFVVISGDASGCAPQERRHGIETIALSAGVTTVNKTAQVTSANTGALLRSWVQVCVCVSE